MWYVVKRIAHGLTWVAILLIPAALMMAALDSLFPEASDVEALAAELVLLAGVAVVATFAIKGRWSLTWPLIVLFVLTWPFGWPIPWVVAFIGLGKLIVYAVGRGRTLAASELTMPAVVGARPRGLVESGNYE
jgi:hypothetical protein